MAKPTVSHRKSKNFNGLEQAPGPCSKCHQPINGYWEYINASHDRRNDGDDPVICLPCLSRLIDNAITAMAQYTKEHPEVLEEGGAHA